MFSDTIYNSIGIIGSYHLALAAVDVGFSYGMLTIMKGTVRRYHFSNTAIWMGSGFKLTVSQLVKKRKKKEPC